MKQLRLNDDDIRRIRQRIIYRLTQLGFARDGEDFAQEILLKFVEGRGQHQTVDQAVIDALRAHYGRPGLPGYGQRFAFETAHSFEEMVSEGAAFASGRNTLDAQLDTERALATVAGTRGGEAVRLYYIDGWSQREIGEHLGVNGSRVSQILKEQLGRIRQQLKWRGGVVKCRRDGCGREFEPIHDGQSYCRKECAPWALLPDVRGDRPKEPEVVKFTDPSLPSVFEEEHEPVELETRTCACGCGKAFRVISTSEQKYASTDCEATVTPGGYIEVMKKHAKKSGAHKAIPANVTGVVGSTELAKMLGISYQTLYNWIKAERIKPLPSEGRNKEFDVAQVREQLAAGKSAGDDQVEDAEPEKEEESELSQRIESLPPRAPQPEPEEEPKEETSASPAMDEVLTLAQRAAVKAYKRELKKAAREAERRGDQALQLGILKHYVFGDHAVEGASA